MHKYEIMFIVKATMESADVKKTAETFKKLVSDLKGTVVEYKELGEKKLAYPIKKELNGYYFVMQVEADKDCVQEFDRKIRLDENVLRHLIIKQEEE